MRGLASWCAAILGALALLIACIAPASAERRVALVIGNSGYKKVPALTNPRNDASKIAASLRRLGFEVTEWSDVDRDKSRQMLKEFSRQATDADVALVYYAGHALEHRGSYYLVPIDAGVDDPDALRYDMLPAAEFQVVLEKVSGIRIMIFDACRTDITKAEADALQPPRDLPGSSKPARGDITVYATAPLDVAEDGKFGNSPFARSLLRQLEEPELDVRRLFRTVSRQVIEATGGRQRPEVSIDLKGRFALNQNETDLTRWAAIRYSSEPSVFQDFLQQFPNSAYAPDAKFRLDVLGRVAERIEQHRREEEAKLNAEQEARDAAEKEKIRIAREEEIRREKEKERRLAALRAELQRQREERDLACRLEAEQIDSLADGDRSPLEQLKRDSKCPENGDRIATALADIARREEAEINRARREEACLRENAQFDDLEQAGDRTKLSALRAKAECPEISHRVDVALAAIDAKEDAERALQKAELDRRMVEKNCKSEAAKIEGLTRAGGKNALNSLRGRLKCADSADRISIALSKVDQLDADEAERLRQEACRAEAAQVASFAGDRRTAELDRLKASPRCQATVAGVDAALAEIAKLEDQDRRTRATAEAAARRDATCRGEADRIQAAAAARDRAGVAAVAAGAQCDDTRQVADSAVARLDADVAQVCEVETGEFQRIDRSDAPALVAFAQKAACSSVRSEAETLVARLGADADRKVRAEQACADDRRRVSELEAQGAAGRDGLTALQAATGCEQLKPVILAALDRAAPIAPAPAPQIDQPAQVARAQKSLQTFGCYAGQIDGARLDETRSALEKYLKVKGNASTPLRIDDALLLEFEREPAKRVCPLECDDDEVERGGRCVAEPRTKPQRDAPAISSREEPRRPPRAERQQERREERRQAHPQREDRPRRTPAQVAAPAAPPRAAPRPVVEANQAPAKPKPRNPAMILGN